MSSDKLQEQGLTHVLDEESNEIVEVSDDMRRMAQAVQQRIDGATVVTSILLQLVRDNKLYLAFGCGSFQDYADTMLPFTRQTAYKYISIAETFAPLLPNVDLKDSVASMRQIEETLSGDEKVSQLGVIGMSKLHELTKLPEADYSDVFKKGVVKLEDGTELNLRELEEKTTREVSQITSKIKKDYQRKLSLQEEDLKKAKGERDHYKTSLEKNQDRIDRAIELESQYGKDAARMEEIDFNMSQAEQALLKIERTFGKVDVEDNDSELVRERINGFLRGIHRVQVAAQERFPWLRDLDEIEEFPSWKVKDDPRLDPESEEFDPDATVEGM